MREKAITSWRDLTLMQLGALLKYSVEDKNHRLYKEWFALTDALNHADAINTKKQKAAGRKWSGFDLNGNMAPLLAYFFTFTAAAHKQALYPDQDLQLEATVREYHLDLLTRNHKRRSVGFEFLFGNIIPHCIVNLDLLDVMNVPVGEKWVKRTSAECVELCWKRILSYLKETDAPGAGTKAADAFAWLEEKNRHAYQAVTSMTGKHMFNFQYECSMGESYPRFLQLLDHWDQTFVALWETFQRSAQQRVRELSAALEMPLDAVSDQRESGRS